MTFRMSLLHVAMATSALIMSAVLAAHAATKFCDIYPERCQYATDGVYYYYPLGYRMPGSTVTRPASARKYTVKYTIKRKMPTTTARKEPVAVAPLKAYGGDEAQSSRPGSNR
jgi:hypothetical protein